MIGTDNSRSHNDDVGDNYLHDNQIVNSSTTSTGRTNTSAVTIVDPATTATTTGTTTTTTTTVQDNLLERFSQGVSDLFVSIEEIKKQYVLNPNNNKNTVTSQRITTTETSLNTTTTGTATTTTNPTTIKWYDVIQTIHPTMERILSIVDAMYHWGCEIRNISARNTQNRNNQYNASSSSSSSSRSSSARGRSNTEEDPTWELLGHCLEKAIQMVQIVFFDFICTKYIEPTIVVVDDDGKEFNTTTTTNNNNNDINNEYNQSILTTESVQAIRRDVQASIGRIVEINLLLLFLQNDYYFSLSSTNNNNNNNNRNRNNNSNSNNNNSNSNMKTINDVVDGYVQYQRNVLRNRSKPAIAKLVQERREGIYDTKFSNFCSVTAPSSTSGASTFNTNTNTNHHYQQQINNTNNKTLLNGTGRIVIVNNDDDDDDNDDVDDDEDQESNIVHDDDEDDDDDYHDTNDQQQGQQQQLPPPQHHHGPVLTIILSEAASLIHPLSSWMTHLLPAIEQQLQQQQRQQQRHQQQRHQQQRHQQQQQQPILGILPTILYKMCQNSIITLNEQTEILTRTLMEWFWEDQHIDTYWMPLIANSNDANNNTTTTTAYTTTTNDADSKQQLQQEQKQHQFNPNTSKKKRRHVLILLDSLLDEMSFTCQILDRYQKLLLTVPTENYSTSAISDPTTNSTSSTTTPTTPTLTSTIIETIVLPELMWKYSSIERYFVRQQWIQALVCAAPVTIVIGTSIVVPSVVEDAQYLCQRSLERAVSTHSKQAIGTVAYSFCTDIWSVDGNNNNNTSTSTGSAAATSSSMTGTDVNVDKNVTIMTSVYQALLEQRGCWKYTLSPEEIAAQEERRMRSKMEELGGGGGVGRAPNSGNFAAALLDALDDELDNNDNSNNKSNKNNNNNNTGSTKKKKGSHPNKIRSPPRSGNHNTGSTSTGFLASLVKLTDSDYNREKSIQRQLDTQFCVLNGIHAAHGACRSLIDSIDDIIEIDEEVLNETMNEVVVSTTPMHRHIAMIQLAREDLLRYASSYESFLKTFCQEMITRWCGRYDSKSYQTIISKNNTNHRSKSKYNTLDDCLEQLILFFADENYELDGLKLIEAENEERLERELIVPFRECRLIQQLALKCEPTVFGLLCETLTSAVVEIIWNIVIINKGGSGEHQQHQQQKQSASRSFPDEGNNTKNDEMEKQPTDNIVYNEIERKRFTDWGAILFSKQVRLLQTFLSSTILSLSPSSMKDGIAQPSSATSTTTTIQPTTSTAISISTSVTSNTSGTSSNSTLLLTPKLWQVWERISLAVSILQLERPSDWLSYRSSPVLQVLGPHEVITIMSLRIDFSKEAIHSVVSTTAM